MKPCPTCGSWLTDRMIDAIGNPQREESCPKAKRKSKITARNENKESKIETLLLLGSLAE